MVRQPSLCYTELFLCNSRGIFHIDLTALSEQSIANQNNQLPAHFLREVEMLRLYLVILTQKQHLHDTKMT